MYALFWTAVGLIFAVSRSGAERSWKSEALPALIEWWLWGLLCPLIIRVDRRLPSYGRRPFVHFLVHLALGPFWVVAFSLCSESICWALGLRPWGHLFINLRQDLFWTMLIYLLIVGVSEADGFRQRHRATELRMERLAKSLSDSRLQALRAQLDPHFLFNALNTISAEVGSHPQLARDMIERLGDLLRSSLELRDRQEVTLGEEMEILGHFVAIQKARFGDRFQFCDSIPMELRLQYVPSLLLQPLVENSIRHGIAQRVEGGTVTIKAARSNDQMLIYVVDDGVGLSPKWRRDRQEGLGLALTAERIETLYPGVGAGLNVTARDGGGTVVEVILPFHQAPEVEYA